MPRTHKAESLPAIDIRPDAVYLPAQIIAALGLRASSIRTERRAGRLRVVRRCGRNFLLGRDILDWLNGGELKNRPKDQAHSNGDSVN